MGPSGATGATGPTGPQGSAGAQGSPGSDGAPGAACKPREYYLTRPSHLGSTALTACAPGFHMAWLWEILDVTALRYRADLGYTNGSIGTDAGVGGIAAVSGWVRTGFPVDNGANVVGVASCAAWTSSSPSLDGTFVFLGSGWTEPATRIGPWGSGVTRCDAPYQVWCVED